MYLSDDAQTLALALRESVEPGAVGVGPDREHLPTLTSLEPDRVREAIVELEALGLVHVTWVIRQPRPGIPKEFTDIAGVNVLAPMWDDFGDDVY